MGGREGGKAEGGGWGEDTNELRRRRVCTPPCPPFLPRLVLNPIPPLSPSSSSHLCPQSRGKFLQENVLEHLVRHLGRQVPHKDREFRRCLHPFPSRPPVEPKPKMGARWKRREGGRKGGWEGERGRVSSKKRREGRGILSPGALSGYFIIIFHPLPGRCSPLLACPTAGEGKPMDSIRPSSCMGSNHPSSTLRACPSPASPVCQ